MTLKSIRPGVLAGTRGPGDCVTAKCSTPNSKAQAPYGQVVYLPLPRDTVRIGGKLCRISPRLKARIQQMARKL